MTTSISDLLQLRDLLFEEAAPTCRENLLAEVADVERRLVSARAYECRPPQAGGDLASVSERSAFGATRWQLLSGDTLDELEAKLTAALQAVRDARSLGVASIVDYVPS
jgi:hypothetical protein